jgi:SAM-dependent methyltransferase
MGQVKSEQLKNTAARSSSKASQLEMPLVLDACCGPRMFWFDRDDSRALFIDRRREVVTRDLGTVKTRNRRPAIVDPHIIADFTRMPFANESFYMVVFDPPHMSKNRSGLSGIFPKLYGTLADNWPEAMRLGFAECFRVLKPNGTLVFKWADSSVPVAQVLMNTPRRPLFGSRRGRHTHWYVFIKDDLANVKI